MPTHSLDRLPHFPGAWYLNAEPPTEPQNQHPESPRSQDELQTPRKDTAKFLPTLTRHELDMWLLNAAYIFVRE